MTGYFIRRFLLIIPTFLGITLAVFVVMHFVPGGPVERQIMRYKMAAAMGEGGAGGGVSRGVEIPAEAIEEMKRYYGFDKPVHIRYALWLWNLLHLDLGRSYIYQDPVWDVIKSRFPISIFLGLTGFVLSYLVCVPLGVWKAVEFATLTILTKNSLMENLGQDYVRTAFAKGLNEQRVIFVHALRNSLIPIATGLGHVISLILAGAFLIEKVFNIDGMGYLGYTSILQRDYPVALGILVISSLLLLIGNILSDIVYVIVDPRIRFK